MRTARFAVAAAVAVMLGVTLASPASAASDAPAGNNGTIKIDDVPIDDGNENVPHPGCTFVVDFFGYDVGARQATLDFVGQAPTGGGPLLHDSFVFDVSSRESGNQLDASRTVDLTDALAGIEPHPKQGWHVKLTVHVDGAQGADVKHKVFWVSDCGEDETAAPAAEEQDEDVVEVPEVEAPEVETPDAVEAANVAAWMHALEVNGASATPAPGAAVLASEATAPTAAATASAPVRTLPRTGTATDALVPLGMGLVASGVGLVLASRRPRKPRPKHAA
jgi:LPXTG-motif cell wall-anchored protein